MDCNVSFVHRIKLTSGSILDANGNWTAEEGKYKKMDLCRAHDLDVSHTCADRRALADLFHFQENATPPRLRFVILR